jgi:hypothetical protein
MKYAVVQSNGAVEVREDSYELPANAFALTDDEFSQLLSESHVFVDGSVVPNPESLQG